MAVRPLKRRLGENRLRRWVSKRVHTSRHGGRRSGDRFVRLRLFYLVDARWRSAGATARQVGDAVVQHRFGGRLAKETYHGMFIANRRFLVSVAPVCDKHAMV